MRALVICFVLPLGTRALGAEPPRKHLENIRPELNWTSLIGCYQGLIKAAGKELPRAAAMGLSGHAFRLEVAPALTPDGMARINYHDALRLYRNLGFDFEHLYGWQLPEDDRPQHAQELRAGPFRELETTTQLRIRESLKQGMPSILCYQLWPPSYGIVVGYDDVQRQFDIESQHGPVTRAYGELFPHEHGTALVDVFVINAIRRVPARDAERTSLEFAVQYLRNGQGEHWKGRVQSGLAGYDVWIRALEKGKLSPLGNAILALTAYEARRDAVNYLKALAERYEVVRDADGRLVRDRHNHPIPDSRRPLLEAASRLFDGSAKSLENLTKMFQLTGEAVLKDHVRQRAVVYLKMARRFETNAIEALQRVLNAPEWHAAGRGPISN